MEWVNLTSSAISLVATAVGTWLAYVTFISPLRRFRWYLRKPEHWEKEYQASGTEFHRHKKHPEFQVVQAEEPTSKDYKEPWIGTMADMEHNMTYRVEVRVHGTYLMSEMFAYLDGGRYFVPMPRVESGGRLPHETGTKDTRRFYYDELQVKLARVMGSVYRDESIESFAKDHDIEIRWPTRGQKLKAWFLGKLPGKSSRRLKG